MSLNFTKTFITSLITMFMSIFLFANILYAFNLVNSIPLPHLYSNVETDYTGYYFGVSTFLNSWDIFFTENQMLNGIQTAMQGVFTAITKLDFGHVLGFSINWGNSELPTWYTILGALIGAFNLLINLPYVLMMIIYLFLFMIYAIMIVVQFILFFLYMIGGVAYSTLPNTEFPTIDPSIWIPQTGFIL